MASCGKFRVGGADCSSWSACDPEGVAAQLTFCLPDDLVEELAHRVAELLASEPLARRYLNAEEASDYTGIQAKTLRTRSWREGIGIPFIQLDNGRLLFDKLALDQWLATRAAPTASSASTHGAQVGADRGWEPV